jgi:hypothetical protein
MTITNGYATAAEFKAEFYPAESTDSIDDGIIENKIEAASRLIDEHCFRRFWANAADESRTYKAEDADLLFTDDIVSITTLQTDTDGDRVYETTWAITDYDLEPENAALDGKPYTRITLAPMGRYAFPAGIAKGVKVTGKFGYAVTVPAKVKSACLLQAERLFKRKDAPFGVIGSAEMGQMQVIPKLDPDVAMMLAPYVRYGIEGV